MKGLEGMGNRFITKGVPRLLGAAQQATNFGGQFAGRGAYSDATHVNNLMMDGGSSTSSVPVFTNTGDETGTVVITHREYVSDIYAPGVANGNAVNFENRPFALNPALQSSFPFLSQIAQNYDEYEFVQLVYSYRSTTTDNGTTSTGQCGTVIMCTNYNASASPFSDKQTMVEYAHAHSCKLTEHMIHGVECDPSKSALSTQLYTRSNPVVTSQDLKTYDKGVFQIAIANCPATFNGFPVGELWVDYTVALRKPKLFVSRGLEIDRDQFYCSTGTDSSIGITRSASALTSVNWFGTKDSWLQGQQNNIGCAIEPLPVGVNTQGIRITFPASYSGPLKIQLNCRLSTVSQVQAGGGSQYYSKTGNVQFINDKFSKGVVTNELTLADAFATVYEIDVYVSSATQGVNNSITLQSTQPTLVSGGSASTTPIQAVELSIEQYQTQSGINQSASEITYKPIFVKYANPTITSDRS